MEGGCHVHHASSTPAPVAATPYRHLSGTPVPFNPHGPSPRPQGLVHSPPGLSRQSAPAGLLPLHTPAPQHAATPIAIHRSASFTPFHSHQLLGGAAAAAATPQQQQQYVDESQQLRDAASSAAAEPISFTQELGAEATAATDGSQPSVAETSTSQPQPPRYCRNCTLPTASAACDSCGHLNSNKAAGLVAPTTRASLVHDASSSVMIAYDERMQLHAEDGWGRPHPERPDRVAAVMTQLSGKGVLRRCRLIPCREITDAELAGVHDAELVKEIARQAQRCGGGPDVHDQGSADGFFQPRRIHDCYVNQHTLLCARLAAGGAADVARAVVERKAAAGAAVVRPPGHHAESGTAMGFCFINNAAVAARAAQAAGARRVLILDYDVHHGNGTQHIFHSDPSVMYMSIHRHDGGTFYPGTGSPDDVGVGPGAGFSVNIGWSGPGAGDADYMAAFDYVVLPIAKEYCPDLVVVSAGFDAALGDPLGGCRVSPQAFGVMTAKLGEVAPLAVVLEGGYNLKAVAQSIEQVVRVLLGEPVPRLFNATVSRARQPAMDSIVATLNAHSRHWSSARAALDALVEQLGEEVLTGGVASQAEGSAAAAAAVAATSEAAAQLSVKATGASQAAGAGADTDQAMDQSA